MRSWLKLTDFYLMALTNVTVTLTSPNERIPLQMERMVSLPSKDISDYTLLLMDNHSGIDKKESASSIPKGLCSEVQTRKFNQIYYW